MQTYAKPTMRGSNEEPACMRLGIVRMNSRGFSLAELMVVVAILGILTVLAAPTLLSYIQTSALQAGARELTTAINLGRQLAIARNTTVCVDAITVPNNILLRTSNPPNSCLGTIWTGPGTDSTGVIRISVPGTLQISAPGGSVVFTNLGAATAQRDYTVTNPVDSKTRTVRVFSSGRLIICPAPPASCQ